jgi:hypothetical protein
VAACRHRARARGAGLRCLRQVAPPSAPRSTSRGC